MSKQSELYKAKSTPKLVTLPSASFVSISGKGNPKDDVHYDQAIQILNKFMLGIKEVCKDKKDISGYYDFEMPPYTCFWILESSKTVYTFANINKSKIYWCLSMQLPEFMTSEIFEEVRTLVAEQNPNLAVYCSVTMQSLSERLAVQMKKTEDEKVAIHKLHLYISDKNYKLKDKAITYHEIFLSDTQKSDIIRIDVEGV